MYGHSSMYPREPHPVLLVARPTAGSNRSVSGKSIRHASHDRSDITEDLSSDEDTFSDNHSEDQSATDEGSVKGRHEPAKSSSVGQSRPSKYDGLRRDPSRSQAFHKTQPTKKKPVVLDEDEHEQQELWT
ncbi:MAG: hypothetical protein LQ350_005482 [Teloschistes chrysophthalmus]|nr:MAG: hypothetical protein LQ350_005482 [Niorma chrysophthalma]